MYSLVQSPWGTDCEAKCFFTDLGNHLGRLTTSSIISVLQELHLYKVPDSLHYLHTSIQVYKLYSVQLCECTCIVNIHHRKCKKEESMLQNTRNATYCIKSIQIFGEIDRRVEKFILIG